jgi:carboxymethylenebutenolidase
MQPLQPDGFLALPTAGNGKAVLVLHPWWGLNETIKAVCRRLAEEGFVAFAPDLYHGKVTDSIDEAEALSSALFDRLEQVQAEVALVAASLMDYAKPESGKLAALGFSLGAFFALDLSINAPDFVHAVVAYYGTRPDADFSHGRAAYLGHYAERDEFEPQEEVDKLEAALKRAGRAVTFHRYTGTGHWFFEADRVQAYNEAAASLSWTRTLAFLRER